MELNVPLFVNVVFEIATIATLFFFVLAVKSPKNKTSSKKSALVLMVLSTWLIIQGVLAHLKVYTADIQSFPPSFFLFGILPTLILILLLFVTKSGKQFINSLPLKQLAFLSIVRIPVELVLFWLYTYKALPIELTFEGKNWDILAGITAPIIAYFGYTKGKIGNLGLLIWNVICLGLLLNIVILAALALPSPLQKIGFEQPNIAVLFYPFCWLPTFIVPIVLVSHLIQIKQLIKRLKSPTITS